MSLAQYKVTKCEDCPFMYQDSEGWYYCNITKDKNGFNEDIVDKNKTPDWCPLLKDTFIEVSHVNN